LRIACNSQVKEAYKYCGSEGYNILKYTYIYIYIYLYLFMKGNKLLSLDVELLEKLKKEGNASALINDLLKAHYSGGAMNKEALTKAIVVQEAELAAQKSNLAALRAQMKEMTRPKTIEERIH
jgi:hypothetical protein